MQSNEFYAVFVGNGAETISAPENQAGPFATRSEARNYCLQQPAYRGQWQVRAVNEQGFLVRYLPEEH